MVARKEGEGEAAVGRALRLPYGRSSGSDCNVPLSRRRLPTAWSSLKPRSSYISPAARSNVVYRQSYRQSIDPRRPSAPPRGHPPARAVHRVHSQSGVPPAHVGLCSLGAHKRPQCGSAAQSSAAFGAKFGPTLLDAGVMLDVQVHSQSTRGCTRRAEESRDNPADLFGPCPQALATTLSASVLPFWEERHNNDCLFGVEREDCARRSGPSFDPRLFFVFLPMPDALSMGQASRLSSVLAVAVGNTPFYVFPVLVPVLHSPNVCTCRRSPASPVVLHDDTSPNTRHLACFHCVLVSHHLTSTSVCFCFLRPPKVTPRWHDSVTCAVRSGWMPSSHRPQPEFLPSSVQLRQSWALSLRCDCPAAAR